MVINNPESEPQSKKESESDTDSLLEELEQIEQDLEQRKIQEENLINEITDMAEGNIALSQKVSSGEASQERSQYEKEKKAKEQEKIDALFADEKSLLEKEEAKIPIIEEKISQIDPAQREEVESKLAKIKESLAQKKESLEKRLKEAWLDFEKEQTVIGEFKGEQEEIAGRPVDFATQEVVKAHELKDIDLDDLKKKVTRELNTRGATHTAFNRLEENQSDFTERRNKLEQAKTDFAAMKENINTSFSRLEATIDDHKFTEEIQSQKDLYKKKEGAKVFKDPKGMKEIEDFLVNKRNELAETLGEVQKIWREYQAKYLYREHSSVMDIESEYFNYSNMRSGEEGVRDPEGKIAQFFQKVKNASDTRQQLAVEVENWRKKYFEREENLIRKINGILL